MNEIKSQNKKESENDSDFILVDDDDDNIDYSSISRANENINSKSKFQADRLELKNQNKRLIKRNRELLIQLEEFKKESQIKTTKYIKKIKYIEKINLKTVQDLKDEHENKLAKAKKQITELNNQLIKMKQIEHKSSEEKKSLTFENMHLKKFYSSDLQEKSKRSLVLNGTKSLNEIISIQQNSFKNLYSSWLDIQKEIKNLI